MEHFLLYIGKAALAAGTFYLLYLVLFQHQKHFVFNRIYLPVSLALSFLIPLITFTTVRYIEPIQTSTVNSFAYLPGAVEISEPEFVYQWYHYLTGIYLLGIIGFLFHLFLGHFRAINIIRFSRLKKLFGVPVNVSNKDVHPFSFFNKIVLSEKTLNNPNLEIIVKHEKIHVDEKHTLDILFAEILFLFQWFNPFAWLIKDAMRNNLEYKTDHQITKDNNAEAYQLAMVGLAHKKGVAPFLTALNGSQLKNRIVMMKKKTENKYSLLKQLVVLPLLAVLVMGLSNKEVRTEIVEAEKTIEIVLDGKVISHNHPALQNIDFTEDFDGHIVMQALGIEDDVIFNTLALNEKSESWTYYLKTRNYIAGENSEFEEMTSPLPVEETFENLEKPQEQLFALDGKILSNEEAKKLDNKDFESATVLSGKHATDKYGEEVKNKTVVDLKTGEPKVKISSNTVVKQKVVKGKVTDTKGAPVAGITILIKATKENTTTDENGNYILKSDSPIETLKVVLNGEVIKEVEVNGNAVANIVLTTDANKKPDEVVVVGYGTNGHTKTEGGFEINEAFKNNGGNNYAVKPIKLPLSTDPEKAPLYIIDGKEIANIENLDQNNIESITVLKDEGAINLYGERAKNGVLLIETKKAKKFDATDKIIIVDGKEYDGDINDIPPSDIHSMEVRKNQPDTNIFDGKGPEPDKIIIQTITKYNSKNQPLILVDGVPHEGNMDDINREDIEAITVLKDATATALYGEKAINGVILVTTKKQTITSELELRQFIAKKIKYPLKPREHNQEGTSKIYMKITESGIVTSVSDEKVKDAIFVDEVVVVGYKTGAGNEVAAEEKLDDYSKYFNVETKHVIYQLGKIDIEEYLGKTIVVTVKYVLQ